LIVFGKRMKNSSLASGASRNFSTTSTQTRRYAGSFLCCLTWNKMLVRQLWAISNNRLFKFDSCGRSGRGFCTSQKRRFHCCFASETRRRPARLLRQCRLPVVDLVAVVRCNRAIENLQARSSTRELSDAATTRTRNSGTRLWNPACAPIAQVEKTYENQHSGRRAPPPLISLNARC
jgi:hypothetical protein